MEILVVDDEKALTSLFQDYLEFTGGHKITIADSGLKALELIKKQKQDLIILDQMMPDINGTDVVFELKKSSQTADIPIVIFSAADAPPFEEKIALGIIDYLRKPIDFEKLKQIIEDLEKQKN